MLSEKNKQGIQPGIRSVSEEINNVHQLSIFNRHRELKKSKDTNQPEGVLLHQSLFIF